MEHVRVFLSHLPRDLDWQGVERAMEESCGMEGKEQVYKALNGQLYNMDLDLQREAKHLITLLADKVRRAKKYYCICLCTLVYPQYENDYFLCVDAA